MISKMTYVFLLTLFLILIAEATYGENIILMIGDGMGFEHVEAGGLYSNGSEGGPLSMENLQYSAEVETLNLFNQITDSAAAASAMASGQKYANGYLSTTIEGLEVPTILETAKGYGMSTGLITTTPLTHATPAAFGAHNESRSNYDDIFNDYIFNSQPDILLGGGYDSYWGVDSQDISNASTQGYTFVETYSELVNLDMNNEEKVLGLFSNSALTFEADRTSLSTDPDLKTMTKMSLDLLEEDSDGFFLMIEGGLIDWLSHYNDSSRISQEVDGFDKAIEEVWDWMITGGPSRIDKTLFIVTADHETGGLNVTDTGTHPPGDIPPMIWGTNGHTDLNVPIYIMGKEVTGTIDNTKIFDTMNSYLNVVVVPESEGSILFALGFSVILLFKKKTLSKYS